MPDMLVKLYNIPDLDPIKAHLFAMGITIRRAMSPEKGILMDWITQHFNAQWASESEISFGKHPISCYIAIQDGQILGFACYDATLKGFFGPLGVDEKARGHGLGRALTLYCLHSMRDEGYGYAIIGDVSSEEWYAKIARATVIEDSEPGIYAGMLYLDSE